MQKKTFGWTWTVNQTRGTALLVLLLGGVGILGSTKSASADEASGPTVLIPSIHVTALRLNGYWAPGAKKPDFSTTGWLPEVDFSIKGPTPGGSQISVEFTKADGRPWFSVNCPTNEIPADEYSHLTSGRDTSTAMEKKYITTVGSFGFKIRCKNELMGENKVLFSGKYSVGRISKATGHPNFKNRADFYINHDWTLPIGYVEYRELTNTVLPPKFIATIWTKGHVNGTDLAGYLFYKGKLVASTKEEGKGASVEDRIDINTVSDDPNDPIWKQWEFEFGAIQTNPDSERQSPYYVFDKNPGEYTFKVLRGGKLCREMKFSVGEDGSLVDNGIATSNAVQVDDMIEPVKVLGTADGAWNKLAWKTDAFYGHPLKGFTTP